MIKYISFDLDGTLSNESFDKILWNQELPKLYAKTHGVSIKDAELHVFSEFYKALFIEKIPNFTDVSYWFNRHKLTDWENLLLDMKHHFFIYEDAQRAVENLSKKYKLIVISSSERTMIDIKLQDNPIISKFEHIYSTPSDFHISMKNKDAFKKLIEVLNIRKDELVHIGDSKHMDYDVPISIGIKSFLIDRERKHKGENVINSLEQVENLLNE